MRASTVRVDALIASALFGVSMAYLISLPHNLGFADESYFLYEAKRLRDGEVMYRDVFQYITPLSSYVMAAMYWLFGTTITTARWTNAATHGVIVACAYLSARGVGVRPALAIAAASAHVAVSEPAWPFASWHWFSTALALLIVTILIRDRWRSSVMRVAGLGVWCGILICTQQQRGVLPTVAVAVIVLLAAARNASIDWRARLRVIGRNGFAFVVGIAVVVVPVLVLFTLLAGPNAVYDALVRYPTESYRASFRTTWGSVAGLSQAYAAQTFPTLLRMAPVALVLPFTRCIGSLRSRANGSGHALLALTIFAAGSLVSIWYYPDFIHIAFVAVPLFICVAETVQWSIGALLPIAAARLIGGLLALVAIGASTQHVRLLRAERWNRYPFAHDTAFGRIDYARRWEGVLVDAVRARLAISASQEIFCYPNLASPYLTTGGRNPTPYQHFFARTFPPRDTARVVTILQEHRVPYILALFAVLRPDDPVAQLIDRDYRLVALPELTDSDEVPAMLLYERKRENG